MKSSIIALLGLLSTFLFNPEVKAANPIIFNSYYPLENVKVATYLALILRRLI